jgi:hypothetical protein
MWLGCGGDFEYAAAGMRRGCGRVSVNVAWVCRCYRYWVLYAAGGRVNVKNEVISHKRQQPTMTKGTNGTTASALTFAIIGVIYMHRLFVLILALCGQ